MLTEEKGLSVRHIESARSEFIRLWQDRAAEVLPDAMALALRTVLYADRVHREA
jgi:hypothetical protein